MRAYKEQIVVFPSDICVPVQHYQYWLEKALAQLNQVERSIYFLRFGRCLTIAGIAEGLGKTWEETDRLIDATVEKIRAVFRSELTKINNQI